MEGNPTPLNDAPLFYLPMELINTTTGAILPKLQSLGIISSVLGGSIRPLLTFSTGKMNNNPSLSLPRHNLLYDTANATSTYRFPPFPNSKPQTLLQSYRIDEFYLHSNIITGHNHLHPFG